MTSRSRNFTSLQEVQCIWTYWYWTLEWRSSSLTHFFPLSPFVFLFLSFSLYHSSCNREIFESAAKGPRFAKLKNWHNGLSAQILNLAQWKAQDRQRNTDDVMWSRQAIRLWEKDWERRQSWFIQHSPMDKCHVHALYSHCAVAGL